MAALRALGAMRRHLQSRFSGVRPRSQAHARPGARGAAASEPRVTELDRADAWMLRKVHETGYLSWFRNGLIATTAGVISYTQSDTGREAAYGFFILGGLCVMYGSGSYVVNLLLLRRLMLLSMSGLVTGGVVVSAVAVLWLCAVSLYVGRLEVEIIHEDECSECKAKKDDGKSDK